MPLRCPPFLDSHQTIDFTHDKKSKAPSRPARSKFPCLTLHQTTPAGPAFVVIVGH